MIFSILIEISSKNRGLHFDLDLDQNGKNKNDEVGILFFFLLLFWISSQREDTHFSILILIFDKTRSVKIKILEIMDITEINICPISRMWTFSILILTDDKTRSYGKMIKFTSTVILKVLLKLMLKSIIHGNHMNRFTIVRATFRLSSPPLNMQLEKVL